jgi:hypothetical protein
MIDPDQRLIDKPMAAASNVVLLSSRRWRSAGRK